MFRKLKIDTAHLLKIDLTFHYQDKLFKLSQNFSKFSAFNLKYAKAGATTQDVLLFVTLQCIGE